MLYYLNGLFVGLLILSNILAVKLFSVGEWIVLPAAALIVCVHLSASGCHYRSVWKRSC